MHVSRLKGARLFWPVWQTRRSVGRLAVRPSRAKCPPFLETCSSPLPSWPMEVTHTRVHTCTHTHTHIHTLTTQVSMYMYIHAGFFDQQFRSTLFTSWASHLQQANITFRPDLARVEVYIEGGRVRGKKGKRKRGRDGWMEKGGEGEGGKLDFPCLSLRTNTVP